MTREELNQDKQEEIIKEERDEKRKKIIILSFKIMAVIMAIFLLFYGYTTYIATSIMKVKEDRIINSKIPDDFNGTKIIHFTDLDYGSTFFLKDLQKLVKEINKRKPDLVLFTGDLIDESYDASTKEIENISKELSKIDSKLGKYAVSGDYDQNDFNVIMNQSNFNILNNNYDLVYNNSNNPILLVGVDSMLLEKDDVELAYAYFNEKNINNNIFTISMMHEPDNVTNMLSKHKSDLVLAGHSHNGYIRLPFIGGLYDIKGSTKYNDSYYKIDNTKLYISSGMGTDGVGFRLFNRPSFNFFRLSNK